MSKGNTLKFIEGALAGLVLGVGASIFFASKKGKEIAVDATDAVADFYKSVAPKIKKIKKMGENDYKAFMKNAAEKYVTAKQLSGEIAKDVIKNSQQSWKHFSKHLVKK